MKFRLLASLLALSIGGCGDEKIVENDVGYYQSEYDKANEDSKRFFPSEYDNHIPNLLACVTCGGNIAKNAEKCPHCGAPGLDTLNAFRLKWAKLVKDHTAKQEKEYQMKNPTFGSEEWGKQQLEKSVEQQQKRNAEEAIFIYSSPVEMNERKYAELASYRLEDYYIYLYREKHKTSMSPLLGGGNFEDDEKEELDSFAKTLDPTRKLCADHYLNGRHEEAAELDETSKYPWVEVD